MSKAATMERFELPKNEVIPKSQEITPFDLRLVTKKIKIKFSVYKISTQMKNMFQTESIAISQKGVLFSTETPYEKGTLMRIWIELPDYWSRKSKHVDYRHTEAPTHFQILSRVVKCEEINQASKYHLLCENLNMEAIDEAVLQDYLVSSSGAGQK